MSLELTEGWTAPLEIVLLGNGTPIVFSASGHTPTLLLKGKGADAFDTAGNLSWFAASCGAVTVRFDSTDLQAARSPYALRIKVTAGLSSSEVLFVPNGRAEVLHVYAP